MTTRCGALGARHNRTRPYLRSQSEQRRRAAGLSQMRDAHRMVRRSLCWKTGHLGSPAGRPGARPDSGCVDSSTPCREGSAVSRGDRGAPIQACKQEAKRRPHSRRHPGRGACNVCKASQRIRSTHAHVWWRRPPAGMSASLPERSAGCQAANVSTSQPHRKVGSILEKKLCKAAYFVCTMLCLQCALIIVATLCVKSDGHPHMVTTISERGRPACPPVTAHAVARICAEAKTSAAGR